MYEVSKVQSAEQHAAAMKVAAIQSQISAFQASICIWQAQAAAYAGSSLHHREVAKAVSTIENLCARIRECSEAICEISQAAEEKVKYYQQFPVGQRS